MIVFTDFQNPNFSGIFPKFLGLRKRKKTGRPRNVIDITDGTRSIMSMFPRLIKERNPVSPATSEENSPNTNGNSVSVSRDVVDI